MNCKLFKLDLIYAIKKLTKEGITLIIDSDNLEIDENDKFINKGTVLSAFEMLVLVKGYPPTLDMIASHRHNGYQYKYHQAYNIYISDVIEEQCNISHVDLISFMDGLENIESLNINDFYLAGVYIREKFNPIGAFEKLKTISTYFSPQSNNVIEKKFMIFNHKRTISIVEVECEIISVMEDLSIKQLFPGEYKVKILKPNFLYENKSGKLIPPAYYSHSLFATAESALRVIEEDFRFDVLRTKAKKKVNDPTVVVEVSSAEVSEFLSKIKIVLL